MCHAQQDAASHQPRQDIELSSCAKAPTNRPALWQHVSGGRIVVQELNAFNLRTAAQ
jgi:hypothetical protein